MAYSNNSYGNNFGRQQAPARQVNITEKKKIDKKTYVDLAEKVIAELPRDNRDANKIQLSTNQIRNVLSLINELYDMVRTDTEKVLSDDVQSHIQYVKMKIIYAAGKDNAVKTFLEKSLLISYLNGIDDSRDDLILVCHYMEALVAYHRFNTNEK
ncbi:type III-A CRISPR-associated protein Csm2 [Huintestinicola sp.]